jgi:hypothetical protein
MAEFLPRKLEQPFVTRGQNELAGTAARIEQTNEQVEESIGSRIRAAKNY